MKPFLEYNDFHKKKKKKTRSDITEIIEKGQKKKKKMLPCSGKIFWLHQWTLFTF